MCAQQLTKQQNLALNKKKPPVPSSLRSFKLFIADHDILGNFVTKENRRHVTPHWLGAVLSWALCLELRVPCLRSPQLFLGASARFTNYLVSSPPHAVEFHDEEQSSGSGATRDAPYRWGESPRAGYGTRSRSRRRKRSSTVALEHACSSPTVRGKTFQSQEVRIPDKRVSDVEIAEIHGQQRLRPLA